MLIIIGILMIAFTGINYVTTKRVIDAGPIKINKEVNHPLQWSPIVGVVLVVGGIVVIVRDKRAV